MNYSGIIVIVGMIAIMYFLMIRPQQRQRKQHQDMVSQLSKGDEVITIGRLHGVVDEVNSAKRTVTLDCEGIYLTFDLSAIASVVRPDANQPAATTPVAESESAEETSESADDFSEESADDAASDDAESKDEEAK